MIHGFCYRGKLKDEEPEVWEKNKWWKTYDLTAFDTFHHNTVGISTRVTDKNDEEIFTKDIVDFFGNRGVVCFENGAFGVSFPNIIDYEDLQQRVREHTGTRNTLNCCRNDNFISLWEICWIFDCYENCCIVLEIIGDTINDPELLD